MNPFDFNKDKKIFAQPIAPDTSHLMEELEETNNQRIQREVEENIANKNITKTYVLLKKTIENAEESTKVNKKISLAALFVAVGTLVVSVVSMIIAIMAFIR